MSTISDEQVQKALDWMREGAAEAAKARAHRVYLDEYLGAMRAKIAAECMEKGDSATAADIKAKASDAYHGLLLTYREAVELDELYRWRRSSADAVMSAWQTLRATERVMGKLQ